MATLISFQFIVALAVLVYCADTAITNAIARRYVRVFCYGIVALLALIFVVLTLVGH
jgi:hypothetical protein